MAAGLWLGGAPARAADCKDPLVGKSRSSVQAGDAERVRRATNNAIGHWQVLARKTYGWRYRFWWKAIDKTVQCTGGAKSKTCKLLG
jgi:hypothetical protein